MANVDGKQVAALMAVSMGAIVLIATGVPQSSVATSLMVAPTTSTRVATPVAAMPTYYRSAAAPAYAQAPEYATYAQEDVADYDMVPVSVPQQASWSPVILMGLIPAAVAAAVAVFRRESAKAVGVMDIEAPLNGVAPMRFGAQSGRPSMALNAKKDIHPEMHEAKVFCGGEHVMTTIGTKKEYVTDIWSGNHPFYNQDGVFVANAGRIDKFKDKFGSLGKLSDIPSGGGSGVMLSMDDKKKPKAKKGKR